MKIRIAIISLLFLTGLLYAQVPTWVYEPYSEYSRVSHLVAVGEGKSRLDAENSAFGNVSRVFGTSVAMDARSKVRYEQNSVNRSASQNTDVSASHNLINCSIDDVYHDTKTNTYHAVAIIPRLETSSILETMIQDNNSAIQSYVEMAEYEYDPLYEFSYLDIASIISAKNDELLSQYSVLTNGLFQNLAEYNTKQLQAQAKQVARSISFGVTEVDTSLLASRIEQTVGTLGMRINRIEPSYYFNVSTNFTSSDTGFGMIIINYVTNIELLDEYGNLLNTFTYSGREGGKTEEDAMRVLENRLSSAIAEDDEKRGTQSLVTQFSLFLESLI